MNKHIPNILTVSRVILFAPLLLILTVNQLWVLATVSFGAGLATNVLDGYIARRWNLCTKKGEKTLQPLCDLAYAIAAVLALTLTGHWPFWIGVLLAVIAAGLQLISDLAIKRPNDRMIQQLKRHQGYVHPFYSVLVLSAAFLAYLIISDPLIPSSALWLWEAPVVIGLAASLYLSFGYLQQMVKSSLVRA